MDDKYDRIGSTKEDDMIANGNRKPMTVKCAMCDTEHVLFVNPEDILAWQCGDYIQDVLAYLTAAERELLISQTCDSCWKELYGDDEEFRGEG